MKKPLGIDYTPKDRVVVLVEIRAAPEAPFGGAGMMLKGLKFACPPGEAERLFKAAVEAITKERENGKSGSTAKKGGRSKAEGPPTSS